MELVTILLLLFIFCCFLYVSTRRPNKFPDGLARLPIFGQTFKGSKPPMHLWKKHKIMGHFIGNHPVVTIQDFHLAKELLNKEEWCGRGTSIIARYFRSHHGVSKVGAAQTSSVLSKGDNEICGDAHIGVRSGSKKPKEHIFKP